MSTMTSPAAPVKVKAKAARRPRTVRPASGVVRLTITINGQSYAAKPLPIEPGSGVVRLVRLRKDAETHYHVHRDEDGHAGCDCPSFEFDHRQRDNGGCKHIAALSAVGLI